MLGMTTQRRPRRTKTVDAILAARGARELGRHYKLAPGSPSLAIDVVSDPVVDTKAMTATFTISTPTIDRVGDLLMPMGINLVNYQKNPVVLWNHGYDVGMNLAIGKSEGPDGKLLITPSDERVVGTCVFSQSNPIAAQIFELVAEKCLRAASVRETPIKSSWLNDDRFGEVLIVDEWELEEWSIVPVGCNPDAVAKTLDRGRLAGRAIDGSILKSLSVLAPELKRFGKGWKSDEASAGFCPKCGAKGLPADSDGQAKCEKGCTYPASEAKESPETQPVKKSYLKTAIAKMSPAELEQSKADADEASMAAIAEEEAKRAKSEEEATTSNTTPTEEMTTMPYGAQVVGAVHASLAGAIANIEQAMGPLENPEVKDALTEIMTKMQENATALEGLYSSAYPDQPALKMDAPAEEEADQSMKSWLASGRTPQYQMAGVSSRLKGLLAAKNLDANQRETIRGVMGHLARMQQTAKAAHKPNTGDATQLASLQKELDGLQAQLAEMSKA